MFWISGLVWMRIDAGVGGLKTWLTEEFLVLPYFGAYSMGSFVCFDLVDWYGRAVYYMWLGKCRWLVAYTPLIYRSKIYNRKHFCKVFTLV